MEEKGKEYGKEVKRGSLVRELMLNHVVRIFVVIF